MFDYCNNNLEECFRSAVLSRSISIVKKFFFEYSCSTGFIPVFPHATRIVDAELKEVWRDRRGKTYLVRIVFDAVFVAEGKRVEGRFESFSLCTVTSSSIYCSPAPEVEGLED